MPIKIIKNEMKSFLNKYNITALMVAFVLGGAISELIKALITDIIMPILTPILKLGTWQTDVLTIGPFSLLGGAFLSQLLYFTVVLVVVFIAVKWIDRASK